MRATFSLSFEVGGGGNSVAEMGATRRYTGRRECTVVYVRRFSEQVVLCMLTYSRTPLIRTLVIRIANYPDPVNLSRILQS